MNTEQKEQAKTAAGLIGKLLERLGVPAKWACVIAGAIIGAAAALAAMATTGCTASYTQTADGAIRYDGALVPVADSLK